MTALSRFRAAACAAAALVVLAVLPARAGEVFEPSASADVAITPVFSAAAESSHVLKAAPGNLYSVYVTTGAVAGYLMTVNAATVPTAGGAAVTPVECVQASANQTVSINFGIGPPDAYSTGIVAIFSTTGCFTYTASATAFFKGRAQ